MEDCLHLCSSYLSANECATTPIGISGEIAAGHLSLWRTSQSMACDSCAACSATVDYICQVSTACLCPFSW